MRRTPCAFVGIVVALLAANPAAAVDYHVGLRFDDGSDEKWITIYETATLEVFITTDDPAALMNQFLVGFSGSTVEGQATMTNLDFLSSQDGLPGWDYSLSNLTGSLTGRFTTAGSPLPADDIMGSFAELVVDSIVLDPDEGVLDPDVHGAWTLVPVPANFDVIVADRLDATPGNFLVDFESVTLHVPEPATGLLLAGAALVGASATRRRTR